MTTIICCACVILGLLAIFALVIILFAIALNLVEDTEIGEEIIDRIIIRWSKDGRRYKENGGKHEL